MTFKPFVAAGVLAALTCAAAPLAFAQQTPAAPPAQPQITHGAAVPGLCVFNEEVLLATNVGRGVTSKIDAEFTTERNALQTEAQRYQNAAPPQAFQEKVRAFQQKVAARQQNLKPEEQAALGRVAAQLEPTIREVYQARRCSILLRREAVMVSAPAHDITPAVLSSLNTKVPQ